MKALELCPYNLNVYFKGYSEYMLPQNLSVLDVCGDIIKYFSLEKALNNIIVSVSSLCDNVKQYIEKGDYYKAKSSYDEIVSLYPKDYRGWLGLLICETQMFSLVSPQTQLTDNYFEHICNSNNIQKDNLNKIEKAYKDYTQANTKLLRLENDKKEYDSSFYQKHADIFFEKDMTKMLVGAIISGIIALFAFLGGISNSLSESGDIAAVGFIIAVICAIVCACLWGSCISLDKKIKAANEEKAQKLKEYDEQIAKQKSLIRKGCNISELL